MSDGRHTVLAHVPMAEAHQARQQGLSLHCPDGALWHGTFGVMVTAMFADVLPEGPLLARIYLAARDDALRVQGTVCEVTEEAIKFTDGYTINRRDESIVSVFI